jgi:hypothetical protein
MLLALKSGGNHAEKTPPESLSGIQIESRVSGQREFAEAGLLSAKR